MLSKNTLCKYQKYNYLPKTVARFQCSPQQDSSAAETKEKCVDRDIRLYYCTTTNCKLLFEKLLKTIFKYLTTSKINKYPCQTLARLTPICRLQPGLYGASQFIRPVSGRYKWFSAVFSRPAIKYCSVIHF